MPSRRILKQLREQLSVGFAISLFLSPQFASVSHAGDDDGHHQGETRTPIKHVIVIIGENRTFDHIFATYVPKGGEKVRNLLSEGIVNADGSPGPHYKKAIQYEATDVAPDLYENAPEKTGPYATLPAPLTGGPTTPYFGSVAEAEMFENGLASDYYVYLTTGGTGQPSKVPDARISYAGKDVNHLPPGPFQLTPGVPYDAYAASPVHRFYQMRQQMDCDANKATDRNPSGCSNRLFPWVEVTVGAGANGKPQPVPFTDATTGEGSTSMGFYNVQQGDAPYLKQLADSYAMSDNYHQAVYGGTGANHVMFGTGDAIWFSDGKGNPAMPPHNVEVGQGSANQGIVDEIEDPNPLPGTNNWYTQDGYGGGSYGSPSYGGGTYTNCSDRGQPGVKSVRDYLDALQVPANCEKDHYYLLNNYNPGYFADGSNAFLDNNDNNGVFTIPPSSLRTIGDELLEKNISWRYYGDQWNVYLTDPYYLNPANAYCNICNFEEYSTSIMTSPTARANLQDTSDLYTDIANDYLPAVAFVKPSGFVDGHPASSKLNLFEGFVKKIVDLVKAHPGLWKDTAIFVTFDEGGGYYDSGYVQQLDYFGDGTRIPLLVVSPYSTGGRISHTYTDHVSVLKFIEKNWRLPPLTRRSRDNFPNPVASNSDPYVPVNGPAIGDLMDFFHFDRCDR